MNAIKYLFGITTQISRQISCRSQCGYKFADLTDKGGEKITFICFCNPYSILQYNMAVLLVDGCADLIYDRPFGTWLCGFNI